MAKRDDQDEMTPLPPPPAPPARDANPWRLPELDRPADRVPPARRPGRREDLPGRERTPQRRIALAAGISMLVLGVVVARLMGGEDIGDAAQSLFPVLIIAIVFASRLRRRQRKAGETRKKD